MGFRRKSSRQGRHIQPHTRAERGSQIAELGAKVDTITLHDVLFRGGAEDRIRKAFKTVDKYAYRATHDEIAENDYNLNIPRYVDTFEPEKPVDLKAVQKEIETRETELAGVRKQMAGCLKGWTLLNSIYIIRLG